MVEVSVIHTKMTDLDCLAAVLNMLGYEVVRSDKTDESSQAGALMSIRIATELCVEVTSGETGLGFSAVWPQIEQRLDLDRNRFVQQISEHYDAQQAARAEVASAVSMVIEDVVAEEFGLEIADVISKELGKTLAEVIDEELAKNAQNSGPRPRLVSDPFELFVLSDGACAYARDKTAPTYLRVQLAEFGYPPNLLRLTSPTTTQRIDQMVTSSWREHALVERHVLNSEWVESDPPLTGWTIANDQEDGVRCEHELIVERAPARGEHFHWLVLLFSVSETGELRRNAANTGVGLYDPHGELIVMFEQPTALDASGTALRAQSLVKQGGLWIEVNDFGAAYPITIRIPGAEPRTNSSFGGPKVA